MVNNFREFVNYIKTHFEDFSRILLFIGCAIVIVLLLPREGKFKYEYQKAKPWMHEDLIAPFDFPIYKLDQDLDTERDSTLKDYKPYFNLNQDVVKEQLDLFTKNYEKKWNKWILKLKTQNTLSNVDGTYQSFIHGKQRYFNLAYNLLENAYHRGILEFSDNYIKDVNPQRPIFVVQDKIATEVLFSDIYTPKSAYQYIFEEIDKREELHTNQLKNQFFRDLNLNEYIVPNLFFDEKASLAVKQSLIGNISLSEGMVQAGERIISKGEVITNETYKVLESLKKEYQDKIGSTSKYANIFAGQLIVVMMAFIVIYLFMRNFRNKILKNQVRTSFILFIIILFFVSARLTLRMNEISFYILPFTIIPIIVRTFYDSRLALFIHSINLILVGFIAPNGFEFILLNFIAGSVAIYSLTNYRRGRIVTTAMLVTGSYCITYFGIILTQQGSLKDINYESFLQFGINGLLVLLSYPLIYVFEKLFGFLSDATLMELSDINQPLLRKLAEIAPGTFQHALQVSSLAEEAIIKIGGNPLLGRAGALYHDIGKMDRSIFFIENQNTGINPHDDLDFEESARIIISHVEKGIQVARSYHLPEPVIDFIRTHHGTSTVHYFYRSFIKRYPDKESERNKFRYSGPKPFSKEMAVLMMADAVEAASKSLPSTNEQAINKLVEDIIENQMREEQFSEANITYKDIALVKELFKQKLRDIYHARITYPKE
jgi:cyclic-di-AMP phosphodiesterase PgpH